MEQRRLGQYVLEGLLGAGGMGEVHRAHDTVRNRQVALKLLPESVGLDHDFTARFRREQRAASCLRDPHIIPIHDFGEIDGRLFIDMRMVDGRDLSHLLAEGPLPPDRAVHLVDQAAQALDSAHAEGLVHRDIKPSNLLVTPSGFVYVVDFGIARGVGTSATSLTATGATVGTLDYMAPERFTTAPLDARADVYSLACVLYECLTARRPFPGTDLPTLMYAHFSTQPEPPSRVDPSLPASLDDVVLRGMAKSPADRFATAGEMAAAAHRALGGRALLAPAWTSAAAPAAPPASSQASASASAPVPPVDAPTLPPASWRTPSAFPTNGAAGSEHQRAEAPAPPPGSPSGRRSRLPVVLLLTGAGLAVVVAVLVSTAALLGWGPFGREDAAPETPVTASGQGASSGAGAAGGASTGDGASTAPETDDAETAGVYPDDTSGDYPDGYADDGSYDPGAQVVWWAAGERFIESGRDGCNPYTFIYGGVQTDPACPPGQVVSDWNVDFVKDAWQQAGFRAESVVNSDLTTFRGEGDYTAYRSGSDVVPAAGDAVLWTDPSGSTGAVGVVLEAQSASKIKVVVGDDGDALVTRWVDPSAFSVRGYPVTGYLSPTYG